MDNLHKFASFMQTQPSYCKEAWKRLHLMGLPKRKDESYKYFPLSELTLSELTLSKPDLPEKRKIEEISYLFPETKENYLFFIEGAFEKRLSSIASSEMLISPLQEAMHSYGIYLKGRMEKELSREKDPMALLQRALSKEGLFIYVPPNKKIKAPLQIVAITSQTAISSPTIYLYLGKDASLELCISSFSQMQNKGVQNLYLDITLDEGASLKIIDYTSRSEGLFFSHVRALLKKKASMQGFLSSFGRVHRHKYQIQILGEGADCKMQGLSLLQGKMESHIHINMIHEESEAISKQFFRAILEGSSKMDFEGKIYIYPKAQKTESYQLSESLLLSDLAKSYVRPNLEIFADDVKASHGATISRMNEEELFYLRSRGIAAKDAKKIFCEGFCKGLLEELFLPSLKEEILKNIFYNVGGK